jgi:hypothetical protein
MRLLIASLTILVLLGCSDDRDSLTPAERAKRAPPLDDGVWKVYSGTESGVTGEKKEAPEEKR